MTASAPDLRWLRAALRAAGYTSEALSRTLGITYPDDIGPLNHTPALERLALDTSPSATLIRLFFLESEEPQRALSAILTPHGCAALVRAGLLRSRAGRLQAQLRLDPVGEQYIASDRRFRRLARSGLHLSGTDPVYPPSSDSFILRDAAVIPPTQRLLDLCTGSGVQALQQAHHAEEMVGVDINPRALAVARFNARLNEVAHLDLRQGNLYAPVAQETFDVILANPPFVASPYRSGPSYHAGGPRGDAPLRRVIAGWSRHVRPGGRAFAISHVAVRTGEDMHVVAADWFAGFPGRAVVLVLETGSPVDLAAAQSLFALDRGLAAYAAEVRRWISALRRRRITTVAAVLIAAEQQGPRSLEVVEAGQRVLPIPLGPTPAQRVTTWFGATEHKADVSSGVAS